MSNRIADSELQKAYKDYFSGKMDEHGIDGLGDLTEEKLKTFFSDISSGWDKGKGPKKASSVSDRLSMVANSLRAVVKK